MTELKPCPFCGGEAEIKYSEWFDSGEPPERHCVWSVGCAKQSTYEYCCPGRLCMNRGWKNMDEAIAAWNTRHREMCENVSKFAKECNHFECSKCGCSVEDAECYYVSIRCKESLEELSWSYCPNCGAEVKR